MSKRKDKVMRRKFLRDSVAGLGTTLIAGQDLAAAKSAFAASPKRLFAPSQSQGANERVRIGVIGTGGRARSLMSTFKSVGGNELTAVCDVYEDNLAQGLALAATGARQCKDYRELLGDKNIDAVIIGSPDHWHKQMTLDAVAAGKDVYVEKPVSHSIEEGEEMVRVIEASKQVVQTGTQQRSWEHYITGKEIVDSGKLGEITFVHTYWYQNYDRRIPKEIFETSKLDW